jgi:hypothetical protein
MFHGSDYEDDPNLGWDGLAGGIEHHIVGNSSQDARRDLMNEPWVGQTGRELSVALCGHAIRRKPNTPRSHNSFGLTTGLQMKPCQAQAGRLSNFHRLPIKPRRGYS